MQQALGDALRALSRAAGGGAGGLPVMDLRSELRLTALDTARAVERRSQLLAQRSTLACAACAELSEQYALVRAERMLRRQQEKLQHELSDASLAVSVTRCTHVCMQYTE